MVELHKWEDDGGRVMADEYAAEGEALAREYNDARIKVCLERHGFYMRSGPSGHFWVFIPVGTAADGSPMTRARLCFPEELRAWREGNFGFIARNLVAEGHPVRVDGPPRPGVFGRLLTALRRLAGRWTA